MIVGKFDSDETYSAKWNAKIASFLEFVNNKIGPLLATPAATASPAGSTLTGPDWTVGDQKPVLCDIPN